MVNAFKNRALKWINEYSPMLDVTETVRKAGMECDNAYLIIWGDKTSKIKVIGGYNYTPVYYPDGREADPSVTGDKAYKNILSNWMSGEEWERQLCDRDGKTYWVVYPSDLIIQNGDRIHVYGYSRKEEIKKVAIIGTALLLTFVFLTMKKR